MWYLQPCAGSLIGKGLRKASLSQSHRATRKLGRVFIDPGGRKEMASNGGSHSPHDRVRRSNPFHRASFPDEHNIDAAEKVE